MTALRFPFQASDRGVAASSQRQRVVREQIEQLLMTLPGERVNRPDFGCGVQRLVFAGADPETVAAAEYLIGASIRRYLRDLLTLDGVRVTVVDTTLSIDILYTLRATGDELAVSFVRPLESPP